MVIRATLTDIYPHMAAEHAIDPAKVAAIMDRATPDGAYGSVNWDLPPVLVVEDEGNGYTPLDGHHRMDAAHRAAHPRIPAYVITAADYCALLAAEFGGYAPGRLADLDDYILIERDGTWITYAAAGMREGD